jgi:hypothetical protein
MMGINMASQGGFEPLLIGTNRPQSKSGQSGWIRFSIGNRLEDQTRGDLAPFS